MTLLFSLAVLMGLAIGLPVALVLRAKRLGFGVRQYGVLLFGRVLARILWRAEIVGRLPDLEGGAVIICNHRGPFDPAFIQLATDRTVHWMVAREYFKNPLFGWFLRAVECIPVGRGGIDTAATKMAIRFAQKGELIGMFPEGRLNVTDELLLPGRPGAAMVAIKARVPVVPCYVVDSPVGNTVLGSLIKRTRTRLIVGERIDISEYYDREKDREVLEALTKRFLVEIAALAGVSDFRPKLAGRLWMREEPTPTETTRA